MSLWSAAVVIGFLGWLGCAFGFLRRAVTPETRFIGPKALFWGVLLLAFWALWVVGLVNA